jgi:hypothetical protein
MKHKDVSSILNRINVAPLLPICPLNPNLSFDVATSVIFDIMDRFANREIFIPTKLSPVI